MKRYKGKVLLEAPHLSVHRGEELTMGYMAIAALLSE